MTPKYLGLLLITLIGVGCGPVLPKLIPAVSQPTELPAAAAGTPRAPLSPTPTPAAATATPTRTTQSTAAPVLNSPDDAIRLAQQKFPALKAVQKKPDGTMGASSDIIVQARAGGWNLIFWQGSGDCPAGCINNHYWYVAVDMADGATWRGEAERVFASASNTMKTTGAPQWVRPP